MAQGYKRATASPTGYGFRFPLEDMKYLIFLSSPRSGNEANRVALRHSARNAYKIRWEVGNEVS